MTACRNRLVVGCLLLLALMCAGATARADIYEEARIAYQQEKNSAASRGDLITSGSNYDRVQQITKQIIAIAPEMRSDVGSWSWDVSYIQSSKVNAHVLPGGKIVVYSGLVEQLSLNDDELAAVLGHEMGHAMLEHVEQGQTEQQIAKVAVGILGIVAAVIGAKHRVDPGIAFNTTTTAGAVGAKYFALLPHGRERELAADTYGAELAARAGFDPMGAVSLQQKMGAKGGGVVEFLSTHPASDTRIQQLAQTVPSTAERFASRRSMQTHAVARTTIPEANKTAVLASNESAPVPAAVASRVEVSQQAVSLVAPSGRAAPPDPDAVTGATAAAKPSKYMFNAERYAKSHDCQLPTATIVARAPTYESFAIRCDGGSNLLVRCDDGQCSQRQD
jgi:predicted Zn-dependent protease